MSQLALLALELTQALLFVCSLFFPPTPLIVFLVAWKKCVIPLSEPLDDHRSRLKWFKEVDVSEGRLGIVTVILILKFANLFILSCLILIILVVVVLLASFWPGLSLESE